VFMIPNVCIARDVFSFRTLSSLRWSTVNETGRTLSGAARMIIGGGQKRTIQVPVVMA
jgi:hypothetical protein